MSNLKQLVKSWTEENKAWHREGSRGVKNLCKLLSVLGYGYNSAHDSTENLISFLEDNPNAVDAIISWICKQDLNAWKENVKDALAHED